MYLCSLKEGETRIINEVLNNNMMELGFIPGSEIKVVSKSPFNGPLVVFIRGASYAIRVSEAMCVSI